MSYEGAMIGGKILPEESFKKIISLMVNKKRDILIQYLINVKQAIDTNNIRLAFLNWEKFQKEVLQNPSTDLVAITNFYNHKSNPQQWIFTNEYETLHKSGTIDMTKVSDELKTVYSSQILSNHLGQLYSIVNKDNIYYKDEMNEIFNSNYSEVKSRLSNAINSDKDYTYGNIIYGKDGVSKRGKIADAFINHLGKIHGQMFSNAKDFFTNLPAQLELDNSIKEEENSYSKFGFLHLLLESLNNTGWWTGGDLIVTDAMGNVMINIQLKTSAKEGSAIGQIKTAKLNEFISILIKDLSTGVEVANTFYKMLKTSSVSEKIGDAIIKDCEKLVEQKLGLN